MKTVLILSGGLDSTTLLYRLLKEGKEVEALSFNYGQRHKKELAMAAETCKRLNIAHKVVDITFLRELLDNSALTGNIAVPQGHYADENMKLTIVPNRNMILASIAIGRAVNNGAGEVALGVHAGDHAIYPDCRPEFLEALRAIAKIANYQPVEIYAPFSNIDKGGIVAEGIKLGVDYGLTWTCYSGLEEPCGKCGSCVERAEAFAKNNVKDPLCK